MLAVAEWRAPRRALARERSRDRGAVRVSPSVGPVPTSAELSEAAQRLARARTELVLAARMASPAPTPPSAEVLIEAARVDLLWATAMLFLGGDAERSRARLVEARQHLADLLERGGYPSYVAFAAVQRGAEVDGAGPAIASARAEFEDAVRDWEGMQSRMLHHDLVAEDLEIDLREQEPLARPCSSRPGRADA